MNKIPKELHLYWNGSGMSKLQTFTVTSFHKYNPDWKINVYVPMQAYTGGSKYIPKYKGEDHFNEVKVLDYVNIVSVNLDDYGIAHDLHDILRSDILRYHILYNIGGVWSDFDVIWLKPMEHFRNIEYFGDTPVDEITSVVSFIKDTSGSHSIGIMIHCQYDEYAKALVDLTKQVRPPYRHEVFGSVMISGRYPTLASMSGFKGLVGVKHETYYPYDIHPPRPTFSRLYTGNDLSLITNNTICLHWYNGKPESKIYVNKNDVGRDCSMTTVLRQGGYI